MGVLEELVRVRPAGCQKQKLLNVHSDMDLVEEKHYLHYHHHLAESGHTLLRSECDSDHGLVLEDDLDSEYIDEENVLAAADSELVVREAMAFEDDLDTDGIGDTCDDDDDGDGISDGKDLCPFDADPLQADFDGDTIGDVCDDDADDDGVSGDDDRNRSIVRGGLDRIGHQGIYLILAKGVNGHNLVIFCLGHAYSPNLVADHLGRRFLQADQATWRGRATNICS